MKAKEVRIFLCYAREDIVTVKAVYQKLSDAGYLPWMDKKDLLPGQNWRIETPKALKAARFVIIFFSKHSVSKEGYVQREYKLALDTLKEKPEGKVYIIPVRLDECEVPESFGHIHYCDLFEEDGLELVLKTIKSHLEEPTQAEEVGIPLEEHQRVLKELEEQKKQFEKERKKLEAEKRRREKKQKEPSAPISETTSKKFRSTPRENYSVDKVKEMIFKNGFADVKWNKNAPGFANQYERQQEGKIIFDRASGLMWQQSGSENQLTFKDTQAYIDQLNQQRFAGYSDWRMPTLEEAMTLMEPRQFNVDLYIDWVFDNKQRWIWTADRISASDAWVVSFSGGGCLPSAVSLSYIYVRAVRSR